MAARKKMSGRIRGVPGYMDEPLMMLRNAILKRAVIDLRAAGTEAEEKRYIAAWFENGCPIGNGVGLLDNTEIQGGELLLKIRTKGRKRRRRNASKNSDKLGQAGRQ